MENEKFQELVLDQFKVMHKRFDNIDKRFDDVDKRFVAIDERFAGMDKRFDNIETRLENVEGQTRENTDMLKAVLHNQEFTNAKLESMTLTMATKDFVKNAIDDAIGAAPLYRTLAQDGDIVVLKKAE